MEMRIDRLIPEPLKSRMGQQYSDIWNQQQVFSPGTYAFFRAPSGKGKSTFIHILYGLRKDYEGSVYWSGKAAGEQTAAQWAEWRSRQISIVFQDLRLFGDLSVEENLLIKQSLTNSPDPATIKQWLSLLGLESKWQQKADTLSYGERQRVAIVRSLLQPFQWLLLDEPFSHLDDENTRKAAQLILERAREQQAGILLVDLEDNDWFPYTRKMLL